MGVLDRVYAQLLREMSDLEDFLSGVESNGDKTKLITRHVSIKYQVDGEDKYLDLDGADIMRLMEHTAMRLREDISRDGRCSKTKDE